MTTATTIATDALGLLGVVDPVEALESDDAAVCLRALNRIVDSLGVDNLMTLAIAYQAVPLSAGDGSYTIGAAGDIAVTKPTRIEQGGYVRAGSTDYPMRKMNRDEWGELTLKSTPGVPKYYYFEPTSHVLGTINFYPVPDSGYTAYIPLKSRLSSFADLTTSYSLSDGYEEFLVTALAIYIAPSYGKEAPQSVIARYKMVKKSIKRLAVQVPTLSLADLRMAGGVGGFGVVSNISGDGDYLLVE